MFRLSYFLVLIALPAVFNQLISFKDGKIGVNFAGYHAEAGLGGLLTGNAAHGGLSASAGTPFGQKAGAGLGGTVDNGQTRGGLYAGASAGYGVGASAALGGNVDEVGASGGSGAEAHARGVSTKTVKLSQTPQQPRQEIPHIQPIDTRFADDVPETPSVVQQLPEERRYLKRKQLRKNKIKQVVVEQRYDEPQYDTSYEAPPRRQPQDNFDYRNFFDFGFFSNAAASFSGAPHPATQGGHVYSVQKQISPGTVVLHKSVVPAHYAQKPQYAPEVKAEERIQDDETNEETYGAASRTKAKATTTYTATKQFQANPNFFNDIFNIPIATLGAVNQFLNNGVASHGGVAITKTVAQSY